MIIRHHSYRGSGAESVRLDAHLWKTEGQQPELVAVRNLYVHRSEDGFAVMAALKAGNQRAKIAYWQIIVSPRKSLRKNEQRLVVDRIVQELKAAGHPVMVFVHNAKLRARAGGGANHLHIIIGHISPASWRALNMRQVLPRLHKVAVLAAYEIGVAPPPTGYRNSVIRALTADGFPHVARWFAEATENAQARRPAPMRDSMRRSAQFAGFDLPSFQARLARLWASGASESDLTSFLGENGVNVRAGRKEGVIALYYGTEFVGALHRIVGGDVDLVRKEFEDRAPALLRLTPVLQASVRAAAPQASQDDRSFALRRQRTVDHLEHDLATLRIRRQRILYESNTSPGANAHEFATASDPAGSLGIDQLLHMEAVLELSLKLLWEDDRRVERPVAELVRFAENALNQAKAQLPDESEERASEAEMPEYGGPPGFGPG